MGIFKTFDIMTMATDNVTEGLSGEHIELDFNKQSLKNICGLIDVFVDENDVDSISVDVDDNTHDIIIYVSGINLERGITTDLFIQIADKAKITILEFRDSENQKITFIFDSIWKMEGNL